MKWCSIYLVGTALSRRSKKDAAAEVLEQIIRAPNIAPTRVFARAGINYFFAKTLVENDLIRSERIGKRHTKVSITDKGRIFLVHYRVCNELLPS
jgi:predicted transcriptional regulator